METLVHCRGKVRGMRARRLGSITMMILATMYPTLLKLLACGAVLAGVALSLRAEAQTKVLATHGVWSAFGGFVENGDQVCGVISSGQEGRTFTIKYFRSDDHLTVQIFKESWKIPRGTEVKLRIVLGGASPWHVTADGVANKVEFDVPRQSVNGFISEFRLANRGEIHFLEGNEGGWTMNLTGSNAAVGVMVQCMQQMRGGASQPFNQSPSQPFGRPPVAPSQPHRGT
jgi:hypothetical protein